MKKLNSIMLLILIAIPTLQSPQFSIQVKGQNIPNFETKPGNLAQLSSWEVILNETFEQVWPPLSGIWTVTDLSNDGYDRKWDDENYKHHGGSWAAWPAGGGANGYSPNTTTNDYFNNLNSRMTYGPFDLSDAVKSDLNFWMWIQTEPCCDYLSLEVSTNGTTFQEIGRWYGNSDWQQLTFLLDAYIGDSSVWIAWRFYSDSLYSQYDGPWIDDIVVRKYVPGQLSSSGTFSYGDRSGSPKVAKHLTAYLYDQDPGGDDDLIGTTTTNENGFFQFPQLVNWDIDDPDQNENNRRLDLYVVVAADYYDSQSSRRRVTNLNGDVYKWNSSIHTNIGDGSTDFTTFLSSQTVSTRAMWIFQDLRKAWQFSKDHTSTQIDVGGVTAKWQSGTNCYLFDIWICSSLFYAGAGGPFLFITDDSIPSSDTIIHEAGHHYMWNMTGFWLWYNTDCFQHGIFSLEDANCAWAEGWADFYPLIVNSENGDTCYDFGIGPCGAGGSAYYNIELINRSSQPPDYYWGDGVEGRVAGALYDIYDAHGDGYDSAAYDFNPIAEIVFWGTVEESYSEFWESWKSNWQDRHHAVRALYQNTIDYNTQPYFTPPLPDVAVLQNFTYPHAIDLWNYTSDDESPDYELFYQVSNISDIRCGISLDGHWINLSPQTNWLGSCSATIQVSESLGNASDLFSVYVVPVTARIYLPNIMNQP